MYPLMPSIHIPFTHGLLAHSSMSRIMIKLEKGQQKKGQWKKAHNKGKKKEQVGGLLTRHKKHNLVH